MKCMCAQTRPRFILSSEGVLGGMEFEPMLTPREKSPLPENVPRGGSNPRHRGQRAHALPTELFRPPVHMFEQVAFHIRLCLFVFLFVCLFVVVVVVFVRFYLFCAVCSVVTIESTSGVEVLSTKLINNKYNHVYDSVDCCKTRASCIGLPG